MDGSEFGEREITAPAPQRIAPTATVPAPRASYLPEPEPLTRRAPSQVVLITSTSTTDYADTWAGHRLTPDRLAWIYRMADNGQPYLMFDVFEHITLNDGHLRGLFEQRMDELAVPWTLRPGDDRAGSMEAAKLLEEALQAVDMEGALEHIALGQFYGASYAEIAWQTRGDGLQVPTYIACVPHRRFAYDEDFCARLTTDKNPYPGEKLERREGSSWIRAESRRWRKQTQAGILRTATWWALFKRLSVRDWLIFAEKFGIPMITGHYTDEAAQKTRDALVTAIATLGTEGRAILGPDTKIEIHDQALRNGQGGGDHLHAGITQLCNSEISKVITAGTLTSDTGGPGSFALGQVHADQKHKLSLADARRIGRIIRRDLCREFVVRNGLAGKAAPPHLHLHVQKLSLLTDAQVLKTLVETGLKVSVAQVREKFEYRAPSGDDDELTPPETSNGGTTADPADPREPADPPS